MAPVPRGALLLPHVWAARRALGYGSRWRWRLVGRRKHAVFGVYVYTSLLARSHSVGSTIVRHRALRVRWRWGVRENTLHIIQIQRDADVTWGSLPIRAPTPLTPNYSTRV